MSLNRASVHLGEGCASFLDASSMSYLKPVFNHTQLKDHYIMYCLVVS